MIRTVLSSRAETLLMRLFVNLIDIVVEAIVFGVITFVPIIVIVRVGWERGCKDQQRGS